MEASVFRLVEGVHGSISGSKCGFFNCPLNGSFEHLGITEVFFFVGEVIVLIK